MLSGFVFDADNLGSKQAAHKQNVDKKSKRDVKKMLRSRHRRLIFAALLKWRGLVAQLGEHLNGIQEVRGSNPLESTKN